MRSKKDVLPERRTKGRELNPQESAFIDAYARLEFNNAAEAYRIAYPKSRKWRDTARPAQEAWLVLQRPHVVEIIEDLRRIRARAIEAAQSRYMVSKEGIIGELACIAFADIRDYATWDGDGKVKFVPSDQLTRQQSDDINELSVDKDGRVRLKLASKRGALVDIARVAGLLEAEVKDKPEDDPEVVKMREAARQQLRELLNKMAIPEPLTIDGSVVASKSKG